MKLETNRLAITTATVFSLLWVLCSVVIALLPGHSMSVTGSMFHADLSSMNWSLSWGGFFMGLISWAVLGGITAWLIAFVYNKFIVKSIS